jgi:hypothetical protein
LNKYITVIDPQGATYGYGGPFVPVSHSVLFEPKNKQFFGFESIQKLFSSHQAMVDFLVMAVDPASGASGGRHNLTWSVSDTPTSTYQSGSVEVLTKNGDTDFNAGVA